MFKETSIFFYLGYHTHLNLKETKYPTKEINFHVI